VAFQHADIVDLLAGPNFWDRHPELQAVYNKYKDSIKRYTVNPPYCNHYAMSCGEVGQVLIDEKEFTTFWDDLKPL